MFKESHHTEDEAQAAHDAYNAKQKEDAEKRKTYQAGVAASNLREREQMLSSPDTLKRAAEYRKEGYLPQAEQHQRDLAAARAKIADLPGSTAEKPQPAGTDGSITGDSEWDDRIRNDPLYRDQGR